MLGDSFAILSRLVQFYVVPDDKYVFDAALYPSVGP